MAVVACLGIIALKDLTKSLDKPRQFGRIHCCILHKCQWLPLSLHPQEQAEAGLTYLPDFLHLFRFECQRGSVTEVLVRPEVF